MICEDRECPPAKLHAVRGKLILCLTSHRNAKPDFKDDVEQKTGADGGVYPAVSTVLRSAGKAVHRRLPYQTKIAACLYPYA
jgi:hypothetical protein